MSAPRRSRSRYPRRRLPFPSRLGDLVGAQARRWRFQHLHRLERIRRIWTEVAGAFVAAHVVPTRLVRRVLRLAADDSSWVSEMTYLGPEILVRLQSLLRGQWVEELKVVVGEPLPPLPEAEKPLELGPVNQAMRERAATVAAEVTDPDLAAAIRRAALAALRRRNA